MYQEYTQVIYMICEAADLVVYPSLCDSIDRRHQALVELVRLGARASSLNCPPSPSTFNSSPVLLRCPCSDHLYPNTLSLRSSTKRIISNFLLLASHHVKYNGQYASIKVARDYMQEEKSGW